MDDVIIRGSDEPHLEQDINPEIQAEIDECIAYADALRDRGIDARVVVEARIPLGLFKRRELWSVIKGVQKEQGRRIVKVESAVTALTERIAELERDNKRLRGIASVEMISHHLEISSSVTLLCCRKMPNTRSEASMTHEEIEELVTCRIAEEMEAREAMMNLEPLKIGMNKKVRMEEMDMEVTEGMEMEVTEEMEMEEMKIEGMEKMEMKIEIGIMA
ncbi:hypothetical protein Tco_0683682 [Tanacetum coccineum]